MTYTPESVERLVDKLWDALMLPDNHLSRYIDRLHSECRGLVIDKDNLRTALASLTEEKDVCEWEREDPEDEYCDSWQSDCKHDFILNENNGPTECEWKFCPYCGKPIKEVTK